MKFFKKALLTTFLVSLFAIPAITNAQGVSAEYRALLIQQIQVLLEMVQDLQERLVEIRGEESDDQGEVEMTSPDRGDNFEYGDEMMISWAPREVGVSDIRIVSDDGDGSVTIYAKKVFGYDVNYDGHFNYEVSYTLDPGSYHVEITTVGGDVVGGETFEIEGEEEVEVTSPDSGDSFTYGDEVEIRWTPDSVGVSDIDIVSEDGDIRLSVYSGRIYGYGDNYKGYFDHELSGAILDPGNYYVELTTVDGRTIEGEEFEIEAPEEEVEVLFPKRSHRFQQGEEMTITWNPNDVGVSDIRIVPVEGGISTTIYARKVFGYDPNYTGQFDYVVSGVLEPDDYQVEVVTVNGTVVRGEVFEIIDSTETSTFEETTNELLELIEQLQNSQ